MPQTATQVSTLDNFLKNFLYTFVYFPTTNWQRAFSPTFNFGCNYEDTATEQYVLDNVGSYGSQLNRIIDVVTVLVSTLKEDALSPEQRIFVQKFRDLAVRADQAASSFQGKDRHDVTLGEVETFLARLKELSQSNPDLYRKAVAQLRAAAGPNN